VKPASISTSVMTHWVSTSSLANKTLRSIEPAPYRLGLPPGEAFRCNSPILK
jgi:hypothetical protein